MKGVKLMLNTFRIFVLLGFIFTATNLSSARCFRACTSADSLNLDTRSGPTWAGNGIGDYATGVFVSIGDTIRITASGSFNNGALTVPSPDGWPILPDPQYGTTIMPDRATNALLGGIGVTSDQHFVTPLDGGDSSVHGPGFVGSNFYGVANDSGQIYLAINDVPLSDNVGFLKVDIIVVPFNKSTIVVENSLPNRMFTLNQNYPNPFNPSTSISFSIPTRSFVSLKIFDLMGREVSTIVSEEMSAGNYSKQWNAVALPSGVYFYRLQSGSYTETKKLVLLR
jgi:hypothetical protein